MIQQYQPRKTPTEKRAKTLLNTAHLLNKLRDYADEIGIPLKPDEEETFWDFIGLLPKNQQSSVIN